MKCPHPGKSAYRTEAAATQALIDPRLNQTLFSPVRVYECSCGKWHLTHQRRKFDRNAGRSKKNRR